jgi:hypothetical protein
MAASTQMVQPATQRYFSNAITNTTSDLPISVIKELKAGFKNYIPLALCMHKACQSAVHSTDPIDTKIGWTVKGEMQLKQKSMNVAWDHYLTTDDFMEIREIFVRGICKYLIMSDDSDSGGDCVMDCADMFQDFFNIIAARPNYAYSGLAILSRLHDRVVHVMGRQAG